MKKPLLSVIIITKNEEAVIKRCIQSVSFADEVIVVDSQSTDQTVQIAQSFGASVQIHLFSNFAEMRNIGLKLARGEWVLYIDADEMVSDDLRNEIQTIISSQHSPHVAYKIPRKNYYFGDNQWPHVEQLERLFKKTAITGWQGAVHESALVHGPIGSLRHPLIHYTHDSITSMVQKTNEWSAIESELLFKSNHPLMVPWRFVRIMLTKFSNSYVMQGGWKLGTVGFVESMYQAYSYFIVYAKLWEKQIAHHD